MRRERKNSILSWLTDNIFRRQKIPDSGKSAMDISDIIPCVKLSPIILSESKPDIGKIGTKPKRPDTIAERFTADLRDLEKASSILNKHK